MIAFQVPSDRGARGATGTRRTDRSRLRAFFVSANEVDFVNEVDFGSFGVAAERRGGDLVGRTLDRPPGGVCATGDRKPAVKWIARIDTLPDGRVLRRGVGVCQDCYDKLTGGDAELAEQVQRMIGGG